MPKGSLQDATVEKMAKAGFNISISSRSYVPYVDDKELEIRLIRAHHYDDAVVIAKWLREREVSCTSVVLRKARWRLRSRATRF